MLNLRSIKQNGKIGVALGALWLAGCSTITGQHTDSSTDTEKTTKETELPVTKLDPSDFNYKMSRFNYIGYNIADEGLTRYGTPRNKTEILQFLDGINLRISKDSLSEKEQNQINEKLTEIGRSIFAANKRQTDKATSTQNLRQNKEAEYLAQIDREPAFYKHPTTIRFRVIAGKFPSQRVINNQNPTPTYDKIRFSIRDQFGKYYFGGGNKWVKQTIRSNSMTPAIQIGLNMMNKGETYELVIPMGTGYGSRKVGPIPGYSTLIMDVTLLDRCSTASCKD